MSRKQTRKRGSKKPRTAAQKRATAKMIAARKRSRKKFGKVLDSMRKRGRLKGPRLYGESPKRKSKGRWVVSKWIKNREGRVIGHKRKWVSAKDYARMWSAR